MTLTTGNPGVYLAAEEATGFGHAGWTRRKPGEPLASWAIRNTLAYLEAGVTADLADGTPNALDRAAGRIIRMAELISWIPREFRDGKINDLGGQDPYPRYGAGANDLDEEAG
jgi:hypothetical protein